MNKSDKTRNYFMLKGPLGKKGYDWWWHSFTAYHKETGKEKPFFIEYFIINPELNKQEVVFGQKQENQENAMMPSYALIKVGVWGQEAKQIHNFYPMKEFSCPENELNVRIGTCTLTESHMKGHCKVTEEEVNDHPEYMCDAGEMTWDIHINKKIAYNVGYGASKFFRRLNAFEMFWHAEGMKTEYEGTILLDGEEYIVIPDKSYGYADKNWGADFTSPWLWISSCNLRSKLSGEILKNSVVEFGGGRPKVFGIALNRRLLGGLYYEGKMYEYNFSKFWKMSNIQFEFIEGKEFHTWKLLAKNDYSILDLTLYCKRDEMLLINYEAPNGKKLHNQLWNGGNGFGEMKLFDIHGKLLDHIEIKNAGCEYGEYDK